MTSNSARDRLNFMKLDAEAQGHIRDSRRTLLDVLPSALDAFYEQVQATPEARRFFSNSAHMQSAKGRQVSHWEQIADAQFDEGYVRAVTTIGETHARIGLEPRWYIGGYAIVLERILGAVLEEAWPKRRLGGAMPGSRSAAAKIGAVAKAALLDMDYAISVYIDAAEEARKKAEAESLEKAQNVVATVGQGLEALAHGELGYRMPDNLPPEYAKLRQDFNSAVETLSQTMTQVRASADGIGAVTDEIARAADDLSHRTEQQAASLEETASALDEITATVSRTSAGVRQASETVGRARGEAVRSGDIVADAVRAMSDIEESSRQITPIVGVIDEIAFQTNLLALNAGVEAARAGDAGKGFAVVASEVRALAQRSADAAKEIKSLISSSSEHVAQGVNLVRMTGETLQKIVGQVAEIDTLVAEIASSAQEQSAGLAEVNTAINQMDQVVQTNAAMVEQSTAATHTLHNETSELSRLVGGFQTGEPAVSTRRPPAPSAPRQKAIASPARALAARVEQSFGATAVKSDGWTEF